MFYNFQNYLIDYYLGTKTFLSSLINRNPPPEYLAARDSAKPDLILIPGVMQKWNVFRRVGRELAKNGYRVHVVAGLKRNMGAIAGAAELVEDYINKNNLRRVVVIGHSKGGLIGKYLLANNNQNGKIIKVIAISTPFGGSLRAKRIPFGSRKELIPNSILLSELAKRSDVNKNITSIFGKFDALVKPLASCRLEGAKNIQIDVYGHHGILFSKEIGEVILDGLGKI